MIDKEILGGVSPLKARQSSRGGSNAKKATSTAKRAGGFAASKGKRGGGGRNVGGYNAQTRFKADKWVKPPSGGTTVIPAPTKPYSYDPDGNMQVNPVDTTADATANATATAGNPAEGYWKQDASELPSYRKAWDNDLEKVQSKYKTYEDYVADIEGQKDMAKAEDWEGIAKKKGISVEEAKATFERRKGKDGQWRWIETKAATGGSSSSAASASTSSKTKK